MSAEPGKVQIVGTPTIHGQKTFALQFLQGRDPDWLLQPFFAEYDANAAWFNELSPAFGEDRFFFEQIVSKPDGLEQRMRLAA